MSFLYPYFLFALVAISIPVIIHLFNFKTYKTVYFSNIQFLKNIKQETKSKSELKHLLVLLSRILAIAALVFAFAQPYKALITNTGLQKEEIVGIYIDNSFSMDAESKYGNLLDVSKSRARAIVDAYKLSARFLLLTNDFEIKHQRLVNKEQFLDFLSDVAVSSNVRSTSEVYARMRDFLSAESLTKTGNKKTSNTVFFLSDFQKTSTDLNTLTNDTTININLIPLASQPTNNLYIDSCWFETPNRSLNQPEKLFVKIVNKSDESYQNIPIKLIINDSIKALASFNIDKNASSVDTLTFTNTQTGLMRSKVEISDYPITYDNLYYFDYAIADSINLLQIVSEKNFREANYFKSLFATDTYFHCAYQSEDAVRTSEFRGYHVIAIDRMKKLTSGLVQELVNYAANGGSVLVIPGLDCEIATYNQLFNVLKSNYYVKLDTQRTVIKTINYADRIYANVFKNTTENVDLPFIFKHFTLSNITQTNDQVLLTTQNNQAALSVTSYGKGKVYIFTFPFTDAATNFARHALFVPTLYNIALFSVVTPQIQYTIGVDEVLTITPGIANFDPNNSEKNIFHITYEPTNYDFIPQQSPDVSSGSIKLNLQGNVKQAGSYLVKSNGDTISSVAFNYNRKESDLSYYQPSEINEIIARNSLKNFSMVEAKSELITHELKQISRGTQYWKWFVMLTLLFIGAEIAILRFWR